MNAEDVRVIQEEETRAKEWKCQLPFKISDNPEFLSVLNLLDCVGDGKYTTCVEVAGISSQLDYPEPCVLQFPTIYTEREY
jgi:hypothetical protein